MTIINGLRKGVSPDTEEDLRQFSQNPYQISNDLQDRIRKSACRTKLQRRPSITFLVVASFILTAILGYSGLVDNRAAASDYPLTAIGIVSDKDGNPIDGATLTLTILRADETVRETRYATTMADGRYQAEPDFSPENWTPDVGDTLEVVAYFGSDYGSNYTVLTSENTIAAIVYVNVTYPLHLIEPHPGTNTAPIPVITVTPSSGSQRTVFLFDGSSSHDDENLSIELEVRWDFEDNGIWDTVWTTEKTTLYQYPNPGSYSVRMGIRDGAGAVNTTTHDVEVISSAPTAAFTMTVGFAEVSVDASTSTDPEGTIEFYDWTFGDGSTASGVTASHRYSTSGTYTITLTVMNDYGLTDTESKSADVVAHFELALVKGWNFVTIPLVGGGYKASNLPGLVMMDSISQWNAGSQTYDKVYIKGVTPPTGDFDILPSCGYWINVGADRIVNLTLGTIPVGPQARIITIPGTTGWVNLGFNTLDTTWKASEVSAMYSGTKVQSIAWYNPVTKAYRVFVPGLPGNPGDFVLTPGQAYWVSVQGSGTFTYTP